MSLQVSWDAFTVGTLPDGRTDEEMATLTILHALREVGDENFMDFAVLFERFGIAGVQDAMANAAQRDPTLEWHRILSIADWNLIADLLSEGARSLRDFFREENQEHLIDEAYSDGYLFSSSPGTLFRRYVASQAN